MNEITEDKKILDKVLNETLISFKTLIPSSDYVNEGLSFNSIGTNNFLSIFQNSNGNSTIDLKLISIVSYVNNVATVVNNFNTFIVLNPNEFNFNLNNVIDYSANPIPNIGFYQCKQILLKPNQTLGVYLEYATGTVPANLSINGSISYIRENGS